MKRYYLDRLTLLESIIKAMIINILISIFIVLIMIVIESIFYIWYIYGLILMYIIVLIVQLIKAYEKTSFYIDNNSLVYCKSDKEIKIELNNITLIEEYYGINYLFGKKTIIIHESNKKYNFLFRKERADIFKNELVEVINSSSNLKDFNI